jgi:hypothetical protein
MKDLLRRSCVPDASCLSIDKAGSGFRFGGYSITGTLSHSSAAVFVSPFHHTVNLLYFWNNKCFAMTEILIDKKKYVLIPEKDYQALQKKAALKTKPVKLLSLEEARAYSKKLIRKWAAEK